jgi:hypothetical protein
MMPFPSIAPAPPPDMLFRSKPVSIVACSQRVPGPECAHEHQRAAQLSALEQPPPPRRLITQRLRFASSPRCGR